MQHFVQKFADGTEQHMVRCSAFAEFTMSDSTENVQKMAGVLAEAGGPEAEAEHNRELYMDVIREFFAQP